MTDKNIINRRNFLKLIGGATAAVAGASLTGCNKNKSTRGGEALTAVPTDQMTYRKANSTGDQISLLGYGCMRWPLLSTPAPDGNVADQEAVNELIDYAIAHGVNYFDTSPVYVQGWSEKVTGEALSRHPRDKYYIATKLSNFSSNTWSREESLKMYYNSLEYLKTDYLDYMLLHAIGQGGMESLHNRYLDNGVLDFLLEEREAGRIRNLGFSYHGDIKVFDYLLSKHDEYKWDFVQIQLNYIDWHYAKNINKSNTNAEYLLEELEKRGIQAIIMEPLLGGRLAKLPDHLAKRLKQEDPNSSIASWAFRYAGTPESILTVLSGMTYMEHLEDNVRTYSPLQPISAKEDKLLMETARLMMEFPLIPCTSCQYCMPCPYGIDIPAIFQHYNKCVSEDNFPQSRQDEEYRKARQAFLVGYDRSVPKLRQANHCIGCDQCTHHCPQGIKIPQEMIHIDEYTEKLKQNIL